MEARRFAERFPMVSRGLFLTGETMSGKTHLAVAILRELFHKFQDDILFVSFDDLVSFHGSASRGQGQRTRWERLKWFLFLYWMALVRPILPARCSS